MVVTLTLPAAPGGVVAVIWLALTTLTEAAAVEPKLTLAPETKFEPVMVTAVPPWAGPLAGETALSAGGFPAGPAALVILT
jgi:hypothetical protein